MKIASIKQQLVVGTLLICAAQASSADSVEVLGEQIIDGGYSSLASWTVSGSVTSSGPGSTINTSGGNAGFDGLFDSSFATLGDTSGAIGGPPVIGVSTLSQTFILPDTVGGGSVASYDLEIGFLSVFDGDDSSSAVVDVFSASLNGITLFSQDSAPLPDCAISTGCPNSQVVNDPFSTTLVGLAPGTYTLTFTLSETAVAGGGNITNTAAGVDNVSVIATAHVPEPGTLALLGLGLFGLAWRKLPSNRV